MKWNVPDESVCVLRIYDPQEQRCFCQRHRYRKCLSISWTVFFAQRCAVCDRGNVHLLKGKTQQEKGGAVTKKAGYTPHCSTCTVTPQAAGETGSRVAWECGGEFRTCFRFWCSERTHCSNWEVNIPGHELLSRWINAFLASVWSHCTNFSSWKLPSLTFLLIFHGLFCWR